MAPITEKQRFNLLPATLVSLAALLLTVSGAWYGTRADAAAAKQKTEEQAVEIRELDRRSQRTDEALKFVGQALGEVRDELKELRRRLR